jgi:hypothetical protein
VAWTRFKYIFKDINHVKLWAFSIVVLPGFAEVVVVNEFLPNAINTFACQQDILKVEWPRHVDDAVDELVGQG